jgi:hypothetical protein
MGFFLFVQEDPSAISTAVDVLAHTEAGGKKADRLQLDVDPKLLVSSKSRGPAPQRHIPTHAPPKRKVCLHHASYTWRELPDYLHTLTLSTESLCVSTASTGDGEGWRKTSSVCFAAVLYSRDSVHAALRYIVSLYPKTIPNCPKFIPNCLRNFLDNSQIFPDFPRFSQNSDT